MNDKQTPKPTLHIAGALDLAPAPERCPVTVPDHVGHFIGGERVPGQDAGQDKTNKGVPMQDDVVARNWRELIRPRRLDVEEDTLTSTYGRFFCEPLERGFGTTLGNALRRVLLSSLQGAAITSIRIDGVQHEFSTIPGVMEDVATVVLNLKDVRVRMNTEGPKTIRLRKSGAGQVVAGDF